MDMIIGVLMASFLGKAVWLWLLFLSIVGLLMAFDLGILNKGGKHLTVKESLRLSVFYIFIASLFGIYIWMALGSQRGLDYFTGYTIEMALSIDNVFVISMIFTYFKIPPKFQYRALVWGIIAVILLRFVMIAVGAALVAKYAWILFIFGAFLIFTGIKMLLVRDSEVDIEHNALVRMLSKYLRVTKELHDQRFFVQLTDQNTGKRAYFATPLFLALCVINVADIVFAVDSVPAIFAITTDTYIVFTANIMAILGLRALYFALAAMVDRFEYLKYALALVLIMIGIKIFWNEFIGHVHPALSLLLTIGLIAGGVVYSLWRSDKKEA